MRFIAPDWRYEKRFSDLGANRTWKKQWIKALDETRPRQNLGGADGRLDGDAPIKYWSRN